MGQHRVGLIDFLLRRLTNAQKSLRLCCIEECKSACKRSKGCLSPAQPILPHFLMATNNCSSEVFYL